MRKAQTEPHVSFTVQPSESHVGIVEMIVENHGPGAAKNIGFALSEDLAIDENPSAALSQTGLFRHGVTYLSPRQRFRFFLVSTIDYPELLAKEPVRVEIAYETVAGEKKVGEYFIDFCVLEGMWGCCSGVPFRHKGEAVPTLSRRTVVAGNSSAKRSAACRQGVRPPDREGGACSPLDELQGARCQSQRDVRFC